MALLISTPTPTPCTCTCTGIPHRFRWSIHSLNKGDVQKTFQRVLVLVPVSTYVSFDPVARPLTIASNKSTSAIYCLSLATPAGKEPCVVSFLSLQSGTGSEGTTPEGKEPEAVGILSLIGNVVWVCFWCWRKSIRSERLDIYILAPLGPAAATESLNSVTKVRCLCRWKFVEKRDAVGWCHGERYVREKTHLRVTVTIRVIPPIK